MMNTEDVKRHFEETEALLTGHFKLSSGLHSDRYLQCARVLQWPDRAEALGAALAEWMAPHAPRVIISPAMGGIIIGQEVGRALGVRAIFAERTDGVFSLRRGFSLQEGEIAGVIEDVVTTGKSTREVLDLVKSLGAKAVVAGAIVDRRREDKTPMVAGVPFVSLMSLDIPAWPAETCPLCQSGRTLMAPGSRFLK